MSESVCFVPTHFTFTEETDGGVAGWLTAERGSPKSNWEEDQAAIVVWGVSYGRPELQLVQNPKFCYYTHPYP